MMVSLALASVDGSKRMDVFITSFVLSCLSIISYPGVDSGTADVNKHLEMGRIHLENRQFSDALTHFHAAVEGDPNNYQIYYKRALVFMALGKYQQAVKDLDKVIQLKADFSAAILQRASLLLRQGQLDQAHIDYENVLRKEPTNEEAITGYANVEEAFKMMDEAKYYVDIDDCSTAVDLLSRLIDICPWDPALRRMRSECHLALGDSAHAVSDLRFTTKLVSDDTNGIYRLSSIQYQLGDLEDALREIRECLKLDPESPLCFPLYKKLKKLDKFVQDAEKSGGREEYSECVDDIKSAFKVDPKIPQNLEWKLRHKLCWCHLKNGEGSLALDHCGKALGIREDAEILCDRAEAYLLNDLFSEAIRDYSRALEIDEDFRRAKEGMSRVEKIKTALNRWKFTKISFLLVLGEEIRINDIGEEVGHNIRLRIFCKHEEPKTLGNYFQSPILKISATTNVQLIYGNSFGDVQRKFIYSHPTEWAQFAPEVDLDLCPNVVKTPFVLVTIIPWLIHGVEIDTVKLTEKVNGLVNMENFKVKDP